MRSVLIVDQRFDSRDWNKWYWVQKDGLNQRLPKAGGWNLNLKSLNFWAADRLREADEVLENLGLPKLMRHERDYVWDLAVMPERLDYLLRCHALFWNDKAAVAFRLAWEPESVLTPML